MPLTYESISYLTFSEVVHEVVCTLSPFSARSHGPGQRHCYITMLVTIVIKKHKLVYCVNDLEYISVLYF